ncbi:hypothetical protein [Paraburkholderia fungorum]|uniref:hypothetical protein n=1 Tax=Paraburkholderia fungorum TaxID=134537 RepID=UPI003D6A5324
MFITAGRAAPEKTIPSQLLGDLGFRFDIVNPKTVEVLRASNLNLIREVTDETRMAVRDVVQRAVERGGAPKDQAREIRQLIGLTPRQAKAVDNYNAALKEEARPTDQIERMTTRYRDKMLNMRANNIARTETTNAATKGQQAAWAQAADKGLLNRVTVRQGWGVTPTDALCEVCAAIPGMNPDGVPLGGFFATPIGPVSGPTVHPQCLCYVFIKDF